MAWERHGTPSGTRFASAGSGATARHRGSLHSNGCSTDMAPKRVIRRGQVPLVGSLLRASSRVVIMYRKQRLLLDPAHVAQRARSAGNGLTPDFRASSLALLCLQVDAAIFKHLRRNAPVDEELVAVAHGALLAAIRLCRGIPLDALQKDMVEILEPRLSQIASLPHDVAAAEIFAAELGWR